MEPGARIKGLTAALLLTATVHPAAGQSLVSTVDNPFKVAASYGYSQVHHDGEWIIVDVDFLADRLRTMRLDKAFGLVTPDGERIDPPNQREYRAALADLRALEADAAPMQLSPWQAFNACHRDFFAVGYGYGRACRMWKLWGNGGIDRTATVGPLRGGGVTLFFHSPDGWPSGEYWLEVDGPGDLAARLPVRLH